MENNTRAYQNLLHAVIFPSIIVLLLIAIVIGSFIYLFKYDHTCAEFVKDGLKMIIPALITYFLASQKYKDK